MVNPNSWSNTVSFFDLAAESPYEIARFRIAPDTYVSNASPSRTCFDHDGNVWIANRGINTVVKIGIDNHRTDIPENTSQSATDLKAWGTDSRVLMEYHLSHDGLTESRVPNSTRIAQSYLLPKTDGISRLTDPSTGIVWEGLSLDISELPSIIGSNVHVYLQNSSSTTPTSLPYGIDILSYGDNWTNVVYTVAPAYQPFRFPFVERGLNNPVEITSFIDPNVMGTDRLDIFYPEGNSLNWYALYTRTAAVYRGTGMGLRGMACDKDGNMWVGSYYNKNGAAQMVAWKIDRLTDVITQYVPGISGQAYGALYNPMSDKIFFTPNTDINTALIECNPSTSAFTARGSSQGYAYGVAIDRAGNMYRPRPSYSNVYKFNSAGTYVGQVDIGHGGHSCCVATLGVGTKYHTVVTTDGVYYSYLDLNSTRTGAVTITNNGSIAIRICRSVNRSGQCYGVYYYPSLAAGATVTLASDITSSNQLSISNVTSTGTLNYQVSYGDPTATGVDYLYVINAEAQNISVVRCSDLAVIQNTKLPTPYLAYHGIAADPYNANTLWAMPYVSSGNTVCKITLNPVTGALSGTPTFINCGTTGHYCYSDFTNYYNILDYT